MNAQQKEEKLKANIQKLGSCAVAFSGGVDSSYLLKTAQDVLGDKVLAVTLKTNSTPQREIEDSKKIAEKYGIKHIVVEIDEFEIEGFAENPPERCYICKKALFTKILKTAKQFNIENILEGTNADDSGDYRPGLKALSELSIKSPLKDVSLSKAEIRELSRIAGLETSDKQSFACLATRFPYGERITKEKLEMINKAEQFLFELGFSHFRVRYHGTVARIEVSDNEFLRFTDKSVRELIYSEYKKIGFSYTALDLKGYRTGSLNEVL